MTINLSVKTNWQQELNLVPRGIIHGILFSGDRRDCCDEAVVAYNQETFVGIATISPRGESYDGIPDIVGLYVSPEFQHQGYGLQLLSAAIERCIERGLPTPIRVTAISANVRGLYSRLPDHLKNKINFIDTSMGLNLQ